MPIDPKKRPWPIFHPILWFSTRRNSAYGMLDQAGMAHRRRGIDPEGLKYLVLPMRTGQVQNLPRSYLNCRMDSWCQKRYSGFTDRLTAGKWYASGRALRPAPWLPKTKFFR